MPRKHVLILGAICSLGVIVGLIIAGPWRHAPHTVAGARLVFSERLLDLGTIDASEETTRVIEMKNVSNEELRIERVLSSCGCSVAEPSRKLLPPGETGSLKVTFNGEGFHGEVHKVIRVVCNDPNSPVKISLHCYVKGGDKGRQGFDCAGQRCLGSPNAGPFLHL